MSYCYEKIITISPKLATLASGQILTHFLMIHRYTHTHTHTQTHTQTQGVPIYMEDFILPCNNSPTSDDQRTGDQPQADGDGMGRAVGGCVCAVGR